jgi:FdhD protein
VRIRLNDGTAFGWSCTPEDLSVLAVGWLVCEGVVRAPDEIEDLTENDAEDGFAACLSVRLAPRALARWKPAPPGGSDLTVGPPALFNPHDREPRRGGSELSELRALLTDRDRVAGWFREMFDQALIRSSVGGVHTGGLVVHGSLARVVEDVSRHHVVDRLVGSAFLNETLGPEAILLVSARISGAMAVKACRAGVGAIISRSVPTELAASVAESHGLVLVGRARREVPHYYWPTGEAG